MRKSFRQPITKNKYESTLKRIISIKIEGIFEPEQVRIQKSTDKEDFGRKGLFRADSNIDL
ncbi:MAG: hypothetical protein JJU02_10245 [Cryomorphaceae bacterium]|nr:hypothetical protein [Cryomorphaceae bacterium]